MLTKACRCIPTAVGSAVHSRGAAAAGRAPGRGGRRAIARRRASGRAPECRARGAPAQPALQPCHTAATHPAQPGSPGWQLGDGQLRPGAGGVQRAGAVHRLQGAPALPASPGTQPHPGLHRATPPGRAAPSSWTALAKASMRLRPSARRLAPSGASWASAARCCRCQPPLACTTSSTATCWRPTRRSRWMSGAPCMLPGPLHPLTATAADTTSPARWPQTWARRCTCTSTC